MEIKGEEKEEVSTDSLFSHSTSKDHSECENRSLNGSLSLQDL